ncbi:MAG: XRE family transcriptional regulator [Planctomycetaceae bacterium]|nr:XRE family transcriptional regulator [Planctomycetaceae bacterium]
MDAFDRDKMRLAIKSSGVLGKNIASLIGKDPTTLSRILAGRHDLDYKDAATIAKACGVAVESFYRVATPGYDMATSADEARMLDVFRRLDDAQRMEMIGYARAVADLAARPPAREEPQAAKPAAPKASLLATVRPALRGYSTISPEQTSSRRPGQHIPVIGRLAAGHGVDTVEAEQFEPGAADEFLEFADAPRNAFAVRVVGDSMEPDYHSGDMVVVDPNRHPTSGVCCVLVKSGGEWRAKVKKVILKGRRVILASLAEGFADMEVKASDVKAYKIIAHLPLMKQGE